MIKLFGGTAAIDEIRPGLYRVLYASERTRMFLREKCQEVPCP
jgi:hypothetical protein